MQPSDLEYLELISNGLNDFLPEIALCVVIVGLIVISLFRSVKGAVHYLALTGVIIHLVLVIARLLSPDTISLFKVIFSIAALLTILITRRQRMEYYMLVIAILLGADLLATSSHFIMILLSLEIVSISSYVLVAGTEADLAPATGARAQAYKGDTKRRAEAAWKFFLFGSAATATMIFGMSYLIGASGTTTLPGHFMGADKVMIAIGGLMTLAGLFFKMTAAPFHLWAPDVYESTPSPVVAYLSVVPKVAGLVAVIRFVGSFPEQPVDWTKVVAGFAILSIVVGTLAALAQKDARRMMAYSTVAQTGFLLAAVSSFTFGSADALYAAGFYAFIFLLMNYAVFMVIQLREGSGNRVLYEDFAGMGYSAVIPAVAITIAFVSLAGIPPVAGFTAKLLVFTTLWGKYASTGDFVFAALFVIGLMATVVSMFFYLKIPFYLFFRQPEQKEALKIGALTNFLLLFLVGLLFTFFLFPSMFDGLGGWVIKVNFVL